MPVVRFPKLGPQFDNGETGEVLELIEESPFPADALPDVLRNMADAIQLSYNVTPEMACPVVLGAVSGSLGKGLKTRSGPDLYVFGNLYMIGCAESGSGKSNTFKPATKPIRDYAADQRSYWEEITRPESEAELKILEREISVLEKRIGSKREERIEGK